jgi:hypothetical protein
LQPVIDVLARRQRDSGHEPGRPPASAKARDEALARAEATELLTTRDDEAVEEEAVANATTAT